ncbi:MAG: glycosyltransferase family 4 protein [Thaumarchaeota archaeon]|nr:glycosyltransferase family 4 protein [Nitrososphaerota archaeon]
MKICLVNSYYPPWIGGAETYVSNLAQRLAVRGHDVTVYCACSPLEPGERVEEGVLVRRLPSRLSFYGTPLVDFPSGMLREGFDVVHCGFPGPYLAALTSFVSVLRRVPSVVTWHNDLPAVTSAAGLLVGVHNLLSPLYLNAFRRIIATTGAYAGSSKVLKRYAGKVRVIPNGVDAVRFSPGVNGGVVREKYGFVGKKVALFVGALTPWHRYKGVDVLLEAFKAVSVKCGDLRLLVVGGGSLLEYYRGVAEGLGLGDRVVFAGGVNAGDLPGFYAACDFLVLPSLDRSEGFGLVLLEAMASGRVVVGCRVGGVVDVVENGVNGLLVEAGDVGGLGAGMVALCGDDGLRIRMGANGRRFAEKHDWSVVAERVAAVYREVV